ncbi:MAG: hypothetical protein DRI24_17635, partial [Deltaproteobacteria bacterium]
LSNAGSEVLRLSRRVNNMAKKTPSFLSRRSSKSEDGRIHLGKYPENGSFTTILHIITTHYLYFAMLFMQL